MARTVSRGVSKKTVALMFGERRDWDACPEPTTVSLVATLERWYAAGAVWRVSTGPRTR